MAAQVEPAPQRRGAGRFERPVLDQPAGIVGNLEGGEVERHALQPDHRLAGDEAQIDDRDRRRSPAEHRAMRPVDALDVDRQDAARDRRAGDRGAVDPPRQLRRRVQAEARANGSKPVTRAARVRGFFFARAATMAASLPHRPPGSRVARTGRADPATGPRIDPARSASSIRRSSSMSSAKRLVGGAQLLDLAHRVHHRGVVAAAELAADLRQRARRSAAWRGTSPPGAAAPPRGRGAASACRRAGS